MLDGNTNKITWVAIASGVVAVLGLASMAMFPSAMSSAKSNITGMVTHFSKASDATSSNALVAGSKLTPVQFKALYGESTLGDRDSKTIDLNQTQKTRVFDNQKVLSVMAQMGNSMDSNNPNNNVDIDSISVPLPDYMQSQSDLSNGRIMPGASYVFDKNNHSVDMNNISDSETYHVGLIVSSGKTASVIKQQFVNFVISGSQLKNLQSNFMTQFHGYHVGDGGNFVSGDDSPLVSNFDVQMKEAMSSGRDSAKAYDKLSVNDKQYLMDYTLYGAFVSAVSNGHQAYTYHDLQAIYTYQ